MPLSEHERRALEDLERTLIQDDPDLVAALRGNAAKKPSLVERFMDVVKVLAGLGALVAGVALQSTIVGVAGFVVMLVGVHSIVKRRERQRDTLEFPSTVSEPQTQPRRKSKFMGKMEDRWNRRKEGPG